MKKLFNLLYIFFVSISLLIPNLFGQQKYRDPAVREFVREIDKSSFTKDEWYILLNRLLLDSVGPRQWKGSFKNVDLTNLYHRIFDEFKKRYNLDTKNAYEFLSRVEKFILLKGFGDIFYTGLLEQNSQAGDVSLKSVEESN